MADNRAGAYARRLAGVFARSAQTLTVSRAGEDHTVTCFVEPLDSSTLNQYFDGNESVALLHPGLMLWVQAGGDVQVDDLFYYPLDLRPGGDLYTVRKQHMFLQGETPLLMLAVCD